MKQNKILAIILAVERGTRLHDLTNKVAKPAVSYGGKYRIIDFPLSNCANSGIDIVGVLTQYESIDGPPTANGKPHIGHVLTRVIKDMIPRYRTMKEYKVPRKAGWDTHGLPVELEVEKLLGLDGKDQIEKYGVEPSRT